MDLYVDINKIKIKIWDLDLFFFFLFKSNCIFDNDKGKVNDMFLVGI